jgi:hypothetical protein
MSKKKTIINLTPPGRIHKEDLSAKGMCAAIATAKGGFTVICIQMRPCRAPTAAVAVK